MTQEPSFEEWQKLRAAAEERRRRSDRTADLLSSRLLAGWALLDSTCPRCVTPLVRNKQKQMFCVACDVWVVRPEDAPAGLAVAPPSAGAQPSAAVVAPDAATAAAPAVSAAAAAAAAAGALPSTGAGAAASSKQAAAACRPPPARPVPSAPASLQPSLPAMAPPLSAAVPAALSPSQAAAVHGAQAAVLAKVSEVNALLATTPAEQVDACRAYLALLADCFRTLDAMAGQLAAAGPAV